MKHRIKKLFTRNIGWKILSIVAAGVFWLIAVNIIDPTIKRTFENIPVEILNETAITSANQVYEVVGGSTVNVTITSKRSLVERLKVSDFAATADLAEMSAVNAVSIQVKLKKNPQNLAYELDTNNAVLKVQLEERVTEKFKVDVTTEGSPAEGYVISSVKTKPNIIEVSGGQSMMKKIDYVGVTLKMNGETEAFSVKETPMAYDATGDPITDNNLTFSASSVRVNVEIEKTIEVPVEVRTTGEPAEGYHLIQTDRQPEYILVSAKDPNAVPDDLTLQLEVDIEGATSDVEREIPINVTKMLGSNYVLQDGSNVVSVRCEIGKSGERKLNITGTDLEVRNTPEGYSVNLSNPKEIYHVTLSGSNDKLKNIEVKDLGAYIDIGSLREGEHTVVMNFNPPAGVRVTSVISVQVKIEKIETETTPEPEPEETEEPEPEKTEEPSDD
ncbi:MAG: hypothetical protein IKQ97_08565 [Eubacterium sp.]|nr:hypothetical protein [Eubacterium sp.]